MAPNENNPIDDAIDKGITTGNTDTRDTRERCKQWLLVAELQYTKTRVEDDIFTPFIKLFQRN